MDKSETNLAFLELLGVVGDIPYTIPDKKGASSIIEKIVADGESPSDVHATFRYKSPTPFEVGTHYHFAKYNDGLLVRVLHDYESPYWQLWKSVNGVAVAEDMTDYEIIWELLNGKS